MPLLAALLALLSSLSFPSGDEEPRPEIVRLASELEASIERHGKDDAKAIDHVNRAAGFYDTCTPKERDLIVKQIGRALRDPRPRPDRKSHEHRLALTAAKALGSMGDAGAKELVPALSLKHFRIDGVLLEEATAELGRTRAKIAIEPLLDAAGTRSIYCVRGAARGMAHWGEADGATRKRLFEGLLKPMQTLADEARSMNGVSGYDIVALFEGARDATYAAFGVLSGGAEERDIDAWRAWWNNNKNKSWDKKKG